jgi:hypothetical protein
MFLRIFVVLTILTLFSSPASAQGVFEPLSFPQSAIATGHTEVLGSIFVALRGGVAVDSSLVIDVSPLSITNAAATDIQRITTGGIGTGVPNLDDAADGIVRIPVTGGGATSGAIRIDGIRVSLAGTGATSVTAKLSWTGGNLLEPPGPVVVVNQVQSGLAADPITDKFSIYDSVVYDATSTIVLREGFKSAFNDSMLYGQTNPTQIRIRVTDMPAGLTMTFPATVTAAETSATLTTTQGSAVDLPRSNGSTEVTYVFASAANSANEIESFTLPFTVSTQGAVGLSQPTIELSLAPIGAAVPGGALPSTSIPRFAEENIVVLEGTSRIITKTLYWTGIDTSLENRLFLTNPSSSDSNLTLEAFDSAGNLVSGANVNSSVRLSLAANQSLDQSLATLFGTSGAAAVATVRVRSTNSSLLGLATASSTSVSESVALTSQTVSSFSTPANDSNTRLHILNASLSSAAGTLSFRDSGGAVLNRSVNIGPMASVALDVATLFGIQSDGYVSGIFDRSIVVFKTSGSSQRLSTTEVRPPAQSSLFYLPFTASGDPYVSELNFINPTTSAFSVLAHLFDKTGSQAGSALIHLPAQTQVTADLARAFQVPAGIFTGYVRLTLPEIRRGPFLAYPEFHADLELSSGPGSTIIPSTSSARQDHYILASGTPGGMYQGIVVLNPGGTPVSATLQALSAAGAVIGTASIALEPGQLIARLATDLFSGVVPEGSVIRVTGSGPVVVTSLTGALSMDMLRASPGQR